MNKIGVILVHYKKISDTVDCINSLIPSHGVELNIVIVDNSEPNDNRLDQITSSHQNVKVIYSDSNLGFAKANNIGINWLKEHVDPDYYFVLNNDTEILPDTLTTLLAGFNVDSEIGITTCKVVYRSNPEIVWYGGGEISYFRGWPVLYDMNKKSTPDGAGKSRFVSFVTGCSMLFTKSAIQKLRGFDETFFMFVEDLELCMRAKELGIKMYYCADTIIYHKVHSSVGEESDYHTKTIHPRNPNLDFLYYHMRANQYHTMRMHLNGKQFFGFFLFFWTKYLYTLLRMLVNGRFDFIRTSSRTLRKIISTRVRRQ